MRRVILWSVVLGWILMAGKTEAKPGKCKPIKSLATQMDTSNRMLTKVLKLSCEVKAMSSKSKKDPAGVYLICQGSIKFHNKDKRSVTLRWVYAKLRSDHQEWNDATELRKTPLRIDLYSGKPRILKPGKTFVHKFSTSGRFESYMVNLGIFQKRKYPSCVTFAEISVVARHSRKRR